MKTPLSLGHLFDTATTVLRCDAKLEHAFGRAVDLAYRRCN